MSGGHLWKRRWGASRFLRTKRKAGARCSRPLARSGLLVSSLREPFACPGKACGRLAVGLAVAVGLQHFVRYPPRDFFLPLLGKITQELAHLLLEVLGFLVPCAVITQRVAMVGAHRISRAVSLWCTSIEEVWDDD